MIVLAWIAKCWRGLLSLRYAANQRIRISMELLAFAQATSFEIRRRNRIPMQIASRIGAQRFPCSCRWYVSAGVAKLALRKVAVARGDAVRLLAQFGRALPVHAFKISNEMAQIVQTDGRHNLLYALESRLQEVSGFSHSPQFQHLRRRIAKVLVKKVKHMKGGKVQMAAKVFRSKVATQIVGEQEVHGRKHSPISASLLENRQFQLRNALDVCSP
jgi:hypothetical protein